MDILDLISRVHITSLIVSLPRWLQYSTFCSCCWCVIICNRDGCLEILFTSVLPHSFPFHIVFLLQLVCRSFSVVPFLLCLEALRHLHTAWCEVYVIQVWSLQTLEGFLCYCNRWKIEWNRWKTASFSNSSSSLHKLCVSFAQSYLNALSMSYNFGVCNLKYSMEVFIFHCSRHELLFIYLLIY